MWEVRARATTDSEIINAVVVASTVAKYAFIMAVRRADPVRRGRSSRPELTSNNITLISKYHVREEKATVGELNFNFGHDFFLNERVQDYACFIIREVFTSRLLADQVITFLSH